MFCQEIGGKVIDRAVSRVLNLTNVLQLAIDTLNDTTLPENNLVYRFICEFFMFFLILVTRYMSSKVTTWPNLHSWLFLFLCHCFFVNLSIFAVSFVLYVIIISSIKTFVSLAICSFISAERGWICPHLSAFFSNSNEKRNRSKTMVITVTNAYFNSFFLIRPLILYVLYKIHQI